MALETVVYPQDQFGGLGYDFILQENHDKCFSGFLENLNSFDHQGMHENNNWDYNSNRNSNNINSSSSSVMHTNSIKDQWDPNSSSPEACTLGEFGSPVMESPPQPLMSATPTTIGGGGRRKRRRAKSGKNKEELESQRMTHIAVERNRRKQMNEYLAVIRSLMPASYVQRGDQASIIGGAINFVKELEQSLQSLEAQKRVDDHHQVQQPPAAGPSGGSARPLFGDFFTFPQYSTRPTPSNGSSVGMANDTAMAENRSALADIEVTVVESHANLKILSKRRPRQLLKIVAGLQCMWLTILHLNVTTVDQMVLYTISVKLEDGCQLTTVDEIADAVNGLLGRIDEEAAFS